MKNSVTWATNPQSSPVGGLRKFDVNKTPSTGKRTGFRQLEKAAGFEEKQILLAFGTAATPTFSDYGPHPCRSRFENWSSCSRVHLNPVFATIK
jgi:hypothetical protein